MKPGVFCRVKDLPQWARDAVAEYLGPRSRPDCEIRSTEVVKLGTPWHESAMRHLVGYKHGEIEHISAPCYDTLINATKKEQAAYMGKPQKLPPGCAILEMLAYPPIVRLYVNPKEFVNPLPSPAKLNDLELKALCIIEGLIPSARKEPFEIYGINEKTFDSLREKGLITKSKAITIQGRNAIRHINLQEKQDIESPSRYFRKLEREKLPE